MKFPLDSLICREGFMLGTVKTIELGLVEGGGEAMIEMEVVGEIRSVVWQQRVWKIESQTYGSRRWSICYFDTMLNYRLAQKFKLIERDKFNHLINTLTLLLMCGIKLPF